MEELLQNNLGKHEMNIVLNSAHSVIFTNISFFAELFHFTTFYCTATNSIHTAKNLVVVGFYDTVKHLTSSASLQTQSVKSPTNFAQSL